MRAEKFEYRKSIFTRTDVSSVVVYATKPFGKVVGEFEIEVLFEIDHRIFGMKPRIIQGFPKFFNEYFEGRDVGLLSL